MAKNLSPLRFLGRRNLDVVAIGDLRLAKGPLCHRDNNARENSSVVTRENNPVLVDSLIKTNGIAKQMKEMDWCRVSY